MRPTLFGTNIGNGTDAAAAAFFTATGIANATIQSAIDTHVKGLKSDGIWPLVTGIWPFVGGTATTNKFNLKDPQDTDGAYRLTFTGGWTHAAGGSTPNGSTGYADTHLNPNTVYANNQCSMGDDVGGSGAITGDKYNMGAYSGVGSNYWGIRPASATEIWLHQYDNAGHGVKTVASVLGVHQGSYDGTNVNLKVDNTTNVAFALAGARPNANIFIGALNLTGSGYGFVGSTFRYAYVGQGLTTTQQAAFYTRIAALQTALGR